MSLTVAVCMIVTLHILIFCVLITCHSKESTRLPNIYTAVREYYCCILR